MLPFVCVNNTFGDKPLFHSNQLIYINGEAMGWFSVENDISKKNIHVKGNGLLLVLNVLIIDLVIISYL